MTPPRLVAVRRSARPTTKAVGSEDAGTERTIADAVQRILDELAASAAAPAAVAAFQRGGVAGLLAVLDMSGFAAELTDALRNPIAGVYFAKAFNSMIELDDATAVLNFADLEPRAIQFATAQAGKRVISITEDIRANIRALVVLGQEGKLTTDQIAGRLRAFIPLLPRHATAAQRTYEAQLQRMLDDGKTLDEARDGAQKALDAATKRYTRVRAEMIARTETITASNTGRFEGWAADINDGVFSKLARKEWVAGHKPCPECDPLTGEVVLWDQPFSSGVLMPPLHPNCRCTAVLLPPDAALRGPSGQDAAAGARTAQRQEGKTPDGPSVMKARALHKNPKSNPDKKVRGGITNAEGALIAADALRASSGATTQADHAAYRDAILNGEPPPTDTEDTPS